MIYESMGKIVAEASHNSTFPRDARRSPLSKPYCRTHHVQGSATLPLTGFENSLPAAAYHFCLALPAIFARELDKAHS